MCVGWAHPRSHAKTRKNALLHDGNKSDRIDARKLAELKFACRPHEIVWGKLIAPWAEYVARKLWTRTRANSSSIPTRLTQQHRREAKGGLPAATITMPKPDRVCRGCGKRIRAEHTDCGKCAIDSATKRLVRAAKIGRIAGHTPEALAKEGKSQRRHAEARSSWAASSQPSWLTSETYSEKIQPLLAHASTSTIASRIGVSRCRGVSPWVLKPEDIREMFFKDGIGLAFDSLSRIKHRVLFSFPESRPQEEKKEKEEE